MSCYLLESNHIGAIVGYLAHRSAPFVDESDSILSKIQNHLYNLKQSGILNFLNPSDHNKLNTLLSSPVDDLPCFLIDLIVTANVNSVNARYSESEEKNTLLKDSILSCFSIASIKTVPQLKRNDLESHSIDLQKQLKIRTWVENMSVEQFVKLLACMNYQCCEAENYDNSLLKIIADYLPLVAVKHSDHYGETEWGLPMGLTA